MATKYKKVVLSVQKFSFHPDKMDCIEKRATS